MGQKQALFINNFCSVALCCVVLLELWNGTEGKPRDANEKKTFGDPFSKFQWNCVYGLTGEKMFCQDNLLKFFLYL